MRLTLVPILPATLHISNPQRRVIRAMQENIVHRVGFVIAAAEGDRFKVLLAKTRPGQWRLPSDSLPVAFAQCDKDAAEPFRAQLNLGKSSYINNLFFRDSREDGKVTRFYALKCTTPERLQKRHVCSTVRLNGRPLKKRHG
jgi:hypothetical protein